MATSEMIFKNDKGETVFYRESFTYPDSWDYNDALMFAKHFARKSENSIDESIERILSPFHGVVDEKIISDMHELFVEQKACLNSPAMFNLGTRPDPIASACFILSVDDDMMSIADLLTNSMMIFKQGAGVGASFHKLRASMETLSGGEGIASGPVSFMRNQDSIGNVVKSGGKHRRAAIMVINRVDHPDIYEFIRCKINEEKKARVLSEAGYGTGIESEAYRTVAFQNMNISVSATDEFMTKATTQGGMFDLTYRTSGEIHSTVLAEEILDKIAETCWECGDPGIQFYDTINRDNPFRGLGEEYEINGSNPCAEFTFIDNSACNLASINLVKFFRDGMFDTFGFNRACKTLIRIMDAIVDIAHYPTEKITYNSRHFRPLGLGFTGLGTLLMKRGIRYGSPEACDIVDAISREMSQTAWLTSHELYEEKGANLHPDEQDALSAHVVRKFGDHMPYGYRNSQVTLLAPTGTISFIMGTGNSTGIEPILALEAFKSVVGGGTIKMTCEAATEAARRLGKDSVQDALSDPETRPVFATAYGEVKVTPQEHLQMMASAQKWLSGAISKTVSMSKESTVDDMKRAIVDAWAMGIKCVALYRDGSKMAQPVNIKKADDTPKRTRMPETRTATVHHFEIMGEDGYITLGRFPDGRVGEIFVNMHKQGSTIQGLLHSWSIALSMALQYGAPFEDVIRKFRGMRFDPSGFTTNRDIEMCTSIVDYVAQFAANMDGIETEAPKHEEIVFQPDAEPNRRTCPSCGNVMVMNGRCHYCPTCGQSGGCS
jgi:ribonucleoside-diphosphate reductase alpha chain